MSYTCKNPWTSIFIWGNGAITHCCYSNIGALGNINSDAVEEVWHSKKLNFIRKQIANGNYERAGCEPFCRPYRWNKYYGQLKKIPEIPEGLGRVENWSKETVPPKPQIVALAMDWNCNFRCTHCLASRSGTGLSEKQINSLWLHVQEAEIVRLMNGEFSINQTTLALIEKISRLENQPTLFMNTNGHISPCEYLSRIENLNSFHLKFSLEGLHEDFERVRIGGNWKKFERNLLSAKELFKQKCVSGKNWRLYLNFCVMKSNYNKLPDVVRFAVKHDIPLVLNTINGMRHVEENIFVYPDSTTGFDEHKNMSQQIEKTIRNPDYCFSNELLQHFDYVKRARESKKFKIPKMLLRYLDGLSTRKMERVFYVLYKLQLNWQSAFLYLLRKLKSRLL